jgi:hypothetical protein
MLAADLIKLIEAEIERHKAVEDMMGPCEIMFDHFAFLPGPSGDIEYHGFSPDAEIQRTEDGVYPILTAIGGPGCTRCKEWANGS